MQAQGDITQILSGIGLFADLTRPQLEEIAHTFDEQYFSPGERILRKGFTGSGFFVVVEGEASVEVEGKKIARLGRGDFFGEISILLGEPPSTDIVATSPLKCLVLAGSDVQPFLEAHPKVMFRILQAEAAKLRSTIQ
jgi:CRP-like cAMP-binding protein